MSLPGARFLPLLLTLAFAQPSMGAPPQPVPGAPAAQEIQVPSPPFTEGIFPCSTCHDPKTMPPNTHRRPLEGMHADIELHHGPAESRWCLDCHDAQNRDRLHLVNGDRIEFTSSYLLCGQCHGDKLRDWRAGVHGKRTGSWNGPKQYLLCVHCHNPHSPRFKALKPMPAPLRPEQIQAPR
jgi:hypothetical protein